MPSQIFKTTPPLDLLFNFLNTICENNGKKYIYNKVAYKKANFLNEAEPFLKEIKQYYFDSKKFYCERQLTYKNLITIIRQICKHHHIPFTSYMKYIKSKYEIIYCIYKPDHLLK